MLLRKSTIFHFTILIIFLQGCSTLQIHQFTVKSKRPQEALDFFKTVDQTIAQAKTQNTVSFSVDGFPYLRTNRFLNALKEKASNEDQWTFLIESMMALDKQARTKEIKALPSEQRSTLISQVAGVSDKEAFMNKLDAYSTLLYHHDKKQPNFYKTLRKALKNRDDYSLFLRTVGLYPIFAIPTTLGTLKMYDEFHNWHQQSPDGLPVLGNLTVFAPKRRKVISEANIKKMFQNSWKTPFNAPRFHQGELELLVHHYAPVIQQDVAANYDRFGQIAWSETGKVEVVAHGPTVYYYPTYSFIKGEPVLQINYVLWYQGRFGPNAPWLERGKFDGLTVRVTLDNEGSPIIVDVMNSCGCYYFSVPAKEKIVKIKPTPFGIDPFVPSWLPEAYPQTPLNLRINSGWHQVQNIFAQEPPANTKTYQLNEYETLERLPNQQREIESIFTPEGIMKGSKRIEPFFFFPAGIPKVGYMRQRGHHPIKLIGHAHFTDADLFDKNFIFK